jgi:hypothetical protein
LSNCIESSVKKLLDNDADLADAIAQILAAEVDGISGTQNVQNLVGGNQIIRPNYGNAIANVQGDVNFTG